MRRKPTLFLIVPLGLMIVSFGVAALLSSLGVRLPVVVAVAVPNLLLALVFVGAALWLGFTIANSSSSSRK
jgi:hypothetical protein